MTIALNPATVANSIAALSISGVTVRDIDEIPQGAGLILPVLYPQPNGWLSDAKPSRMTFGSGGTAKMNFEYTLHYVFLNSEAGSGVSQTDPIAPMVAKLELILEAILTNDILTGLVDIQLLNVDAFGRIPDASGNEYWGAVLSFHCLEFAQ